MNKNYYLNKEGAFVIEDYQHSKLFADFIASSKISDPGDVNMRTYLQYDR